MADINSPLGDDEVGGFLTETDLFDLIGQTYGIGETQVPDSHLTKKVMSKHKKRSKKYLEQVLYWIITSDIIRRSEQILERARMEGDSEVIRDLEELDDEIIRIMEEAEDSLPDFPRNGIKDDLVLEERLRDIHPAVDVYQGNKLKKATGQLRLAKKTLTKCKNESTDLRREHQQHIAKEEANTDKKKDIQKI
eukprot:1688407-Ditylum_brightwellii.AAC.1